MIPRLLTRLSAALYDLGHYVDTLAIGRALVRQYRRLHKERSPCAEEIMLAVSRLKARARRLPDDSTAHAIALRCAAQLFLRLGEPATSPASSGDRNPAAATVPETGT